MNSPWPFIIIRHTVGINDMPDVLAQLMESHRRYRGACDEFWFCADRGRKKPEVLASEFAKIAKYRPLCEEAGIRLSYQQGLTLGHGASHDGSAKPGDQEFPEDAWQVGKDGNRLGFLCPRAPATLAYEREYIKTLVKTASPDSIWLDDDLRLGVCKPDGCFCPRCIAAFNAKTGGNWTRETLVERLYSDAEREPVRAAWIDFNAESLAVFAAVACETVDELGND